MKIELMTSVKINGHKFLLSFVPCAVCQIVPERRTNSYGTAHL